MEDNKSTEINAFGNKFSIRNSVLKETLDSFWDKNELSDTSEEFKETNTPGFSKYVYNKPDMNTLIKNISISKGNNLSVEELHNIFSNEIEEEISYIKYGNEKFNIEFSIPLDIENELLILDSIFYKYLKNDIPTNLTFIKNLRYPIFLNNIKYKNIEISDKPYIAFLCVEAVVDIIALTYLDNSGCKNDYKDNKLLSKGEGCDFVNFDFIGLEIEEIIFKYMFYSIYETTDVDMATNYIKNNLDKNDFYKIISIINLITEKVISVTTNYRQCVFNINYTGNNVVLNLGENIQAYRYKEAIEYKNIFEAHKDKEENLYLNGTVRVD